MPILLLLLSTATPDAPRARAVGGDQARAGERPPSDRERFLPAAARLASRAICLRSTHPRRASSGGAKRACASARGKDRRRRIGSTPGATTDRAGNDRRSAARREGAGLSAARDVRVGGRRLAGGDARCRSGDCGSSRARAPSTERRHDDSGRGSRSIASSRRRPTPGRRRPPSFRSVTSRSGLRSRSA